MEPDASSSPRPLRRACPREVLDCVLLPAPRHPKTVSYTPAQMDPSAQECVRPPLYMEIALPSSKRKPVVGDHPNISSSVKRPRLDGKDETPFMRGKGGGGPWRRFSGPRKPEDQDGIDTSRFARFLAQPPFEEWNARGRLQFCQELVKGKKHPDNACELLEIFDFTYLPDLKVILCQRHGIILPLNSLIKHTKTHHSPTFQLLTAHLWTEFLEHILCIFDAICLTSQSLSLPETVATLIRVLSPQIRPARYRVRCPEKSCGRWLVTKSNNNADVLRHLRSDHKEGAIPEVLEYSWCQMIPIHAVTSISWHCFRLVNHIPQSVNDPPPPAFQERLGIVSPSSAWFNELHWNETQGSIRHIPMEILLHLADPRPNITDPNADAIRRYIEVGLVPVRREVEDYLRNGQHFISTLHGAYRQALKPG